jgi:hypothetical protein
MIMAQLKKFREKFSRMDLMVISAFVIVVTTVPLIWPIGLPVPVTATTEVVYKKVESLPPGGVVVVGLDCSPAGWSEVEPASRAVMQHLFTKPVKIVIVAFYSPMGAQLAESLLSNIDKGTKRYGVDYVNLGYFPGEEVAKAGFAADVHKIAPKDFYGTNIEQLPIMGSIKSAKDIAFYITITDYETGVEQYTRQIVSPYNIPLALIIGAGSSATMAPYLRSGQVIGAVFGLQGGGEYEVLTKRPGIALKETDALSLTALLSVIFIFIGNGVHFAKKIFPEHGGAN